MQFLRMAPLVFVEVYLGEEGEEGAGRLFFRFEDELLRVTPNGNVFLPYWDTRLDQRLPHARDSILWSDQFMGTRSGIVDTGPFAHWTTVINKLKRGSASAERGEEELISYKKFREVMGLAD